MKKIILMSLEMTPLEWSPAKYQLLEELSNRGFETYLFTPAKLKHRRNYAWINHVVNTKNMSDRDIQKRYKILHLILLLQQYILIRLQSINCLIV